MTVEFRETVGCNLHILQSQEGVFGTIISRCADDAVHPTLEGFADAKLRKISKPDWAETVRERAEVSGYPAIHAQGTYTLTVRDYRMKMLSDMYFIFAGQRGFELEFFHPPGDSGSYQALKKDLIAGLKVHGAGQAARLNEFERFLRDTREEVQADKDVQAAIADLKHQDGIVRLKAVKELGEMGPRARAAAPDLTHLARNDPDEDVRQIAARALTRIQGQAAATDLPLAEGAGPPAPDRRGADAPPPPPLPMPDKAPPLPMPDRPTPVTRAVSDESAKLVGTWQGNFSLGGVGHQETVAFGADGSVHSVAFNAWGRMVWNRQGKFSFKSGILTVNYPDSATQPTRVTLGQDSFDLYIGQYRIVYQRVR